MDNDLYKDFDEFLRAHKIRGVYEFGRWLRPRLRRKAYFMCHKKELLEYKKQLLNGELYYGGYADVWNDDAEIHCGKCYPVWR